MIYPIVILAGGLATRLRPLTETLPKSLIPINGEPFIAHQLRLLHTQGIQHVVMCIGYLGDMIIDFVEDGSQFGVTVDYSTEGPTLLGTAGAIKQALPLLPNNFFVLYGDSYLLCDYTAIQQSYMNAKKIALMTIFHNQDQWDTSNIECVNQQILAYNKDIQTPRMHYIDYGLGIFNKSAFDFIQDHEVYDLALLYQQCLSQKQLAAYEVKQRFYEIGSMTGIEELSAFLTQQKTTCHQETPCNSSVNS